MSIQGGSREFYRAFLEVAGWARIVVQEYFSFVLKFHFLCKVLVVHCGSNGAHFLTVDDMVSRKWTEAVVDGQCGAMPAVIPAIMDELLKWRANWRSRS